MPIEQLFPSAQPAHEDATPTPQVKPVAPHWHMWKRISLHVLLATLTLLAVAAWKLPRAPARARLMPLQAAAVAVEPVSVQAIAKPELAAQPAVAPAVRTAEKFKTQQERRAIELVIAGDYLAAEDVYRALASERPESPAFREAARILAARHMPVRGAK